MKEDKVPDPAWESMMNWVGIFPTDPLGSLTFVPGEEAAEPSPDADEL